VLENSDGVNAREILASKCAEYSTTNETIGAALWLSRGNAVGRISEA
jgi:hypothetical protein